MEGERKKERGGKEKGSVEVEGEEGKEDRKEGRKLCTCQGVF